MHVKRRDAHPLLATVAIAIALLVAPGLATAHTRVTLGHLHIARVKHATSYPKAPAHSSVPASVGPCTGITDTPTAANIAEVQAATLCLVNAVRAHFGIRPLVEDRRLDAAALAHSRDMVANDYFDHESPSGQTEIDFVRATGYLDGAANWSIGENLGFGTRELTTPVSMVIAWFFSAEHRANMLSRDYTDTGMGIVASAPASQTTDRPAATYTQEFGSTSS
jgi:uncharacterized protein YkwD